MRPAILLSLTAAVVLLLVLPTLADEPAPEPPAPAPAAPEADAARIEGLIGDLAAPDFMTRESASRELLKIGEPAREALKKTMDASDNMEARWRAEQILRRLDREGERRVGEQPPVPGSGNERPGSRMAELERKMEEIRRRFDKRLSEMGLGGPNFGMPSLGRKQTVLEAPGLRLEIELFGRMLAYVRLIDTATGRVYRGPDLEGAIARAPVLADHEGMAGLKERWADFKKANPVLFPFERPAPTFSTTFSMNGVTVSQGPDGAVVRIQETDERGDVTEKEYKGATIDEIKEKYPEVAERMGPIGIDVRVGSPRIIRDRRPEVRLPVRPAPAPVPLPEEEPFRGVFGVVIVTPEPVLAVHLGLAPGHGALVAQVVPGSQADLMGVKQYDVILTVNGRPVIDMDATVETLREVGRDAAPVVFEIIRRGRRETLRR